MTKKTGRTSPGRTIDVAAKAKIALKALREQATATAPATRYHLDLKNIFSWTKRLRAPAARAFDSRVDREAEAARAVNCASECEGRAVDGEAFRSRGGPDRERPGPPPDARSRPPRSFCRSGGNACCCRGPARGACRPPPAGQWRCRPPRHGHGGQRRGVAHHADSSNRPSNPSRRSDDAEGRNRPQPDRQSGPSGPTEGIPFNPPLSANRRNTVLAKRMSQHNLG